MKKWNNGVMKWSVLFLFTLSAMGALAGDPPKGMSVPLSEDVLYQPGPYELGKDSLPQEGVLMGKITKSVLPKSTIYPGTLHEVWVYTPAQYDGKTPAAVMVFMDGNAYVGDKSNYRATTVMDNLIAAGDIPVTIGIFITPGHKGDTLPKGYWGKRNHRSAEYDTPDDTYARFLLKDVLPVVAKDLNLTDDPDQRAICGTSSGGICAFKTAWHRPDAFRKVLSTIGSFVNIRGGHVYPALIRKEKVRPIRVFMQAGMNDLDNTHGNWWLGNQQMARALAYEDRYDYRFVAGDEGHNAKHGAAVFPDALRWLWRGWDAEKPEPERP
ncbi:MAG: alpha/beta hydrolase-fold protein [Planctomycetota bacterium]